MIPFLASLRSRLLISYLFVVTLSLLAAALALSYLLQGYRDQVALARLADMSVPIAFQARTMVRLGASPDEIVTYLSEQANDLNVRVLLVSRQGEVLQDTAGAGNLQGQTLNIPAPPLLDARRPQLGRYVPTKGQAMLYAILPVDTLLPRASPNGVAYLVLAQRDYLASTLRELASRLLLAGAVAMAAATLIAMLIARSLYGPIRHLIVASERMAHGDYSQRVPVEGPQEMADLALGFNSMAAEVEKSRQVLRDFVANVSHELKTPLTAIRGFVQALGDGTVTDEEGKTKALAIMDEETRRLQGLVAELLDLSRIEARQIAMARGPVSLADLVRHCTEIFALRAEEQGVALQTHIAEGTVAAGDADRLEQLLTNLLDNALKHTPRGGRISITAESAQPGLLALAVADSGPGIRENELPHVFERFYTSHGGTGGTGLGLAIAREIARAHGGDISVTSTRAVGSTFTVTLPAWADEERESPPSPSPALQS